MKGQSVDRAKEEETHHVRERPGCADCDQCGPQDHDCALSRWDLRVQNGKHASSPRKSKQHLSSSKQSGEVFLMGKIMQTVDSPACPFVILEFFIVAVEVCGIGDQNVDPVEKDAQPSRPQWVAFPQMRLELN